MRPFEVMLQQQQAAKQFVEKKLAKQAAKVPEASSDVKSAKAWVKATGDSREGTLASIAKRTLEQRIADQHREDEKKIAALKAELQKTSATRIKA